LWEEKVVVRMVMVCVSSGVPGRASEGRHEAQGRLQLSGTGNKAQQSDDQRHVQMMVEFMLYLDLRFWVMDGLMLGSFYLSPILHSCSLQFWSVCDTAFRKLHGDAANSDMKSQQVMA
jgi:hypothetical protein